MYKIIQKCEPEVKNIINAISKYPDKVMLTILVIYSLNKTYYLINDIMDKGCALDLNINDKVVISLKRV